MFRKGAFCILCCTLALGAALLREAVARLPANPSAQLQDYRIGVKVEMVNLYATVHDRKGRIVTGLTQNDFIIYDDGAPQTISQFSREYMPLSVVLLLDTSSSMAGKKLDNAKRSLDQFLKRLNSGDEAMLVTFDSRPIVAQPFTKDLDSIRRSIRRVEALGSTALYDAILRGLQESQNAGNRRRVLLLLSDGINTYGNAELNGTIARLRRSAAELFAIGLETELPDEFRSSEATRTILSALTSSAGGEAFIVLQSKELGRVCDQISDRMHHQYTFAYYPPKTTNGRWRSVRIEARPAGMRVVASKTGYYPGTDTPHTQR